MIPAAILVIFPFAMAYAAASDLVSMTIANRVPALLAVSFLGLAVLTGMPAGAIGLHLLLGAACLLVTFGFFAAGWMGAGDAKLITASLLWFGPGEAAVQYLAVSAALGGALTLGLLVARAHLAPVTGIDFLDRLLEHDAGVPYAIALGAGGLAVYPSSPWVDIALRGVS